MNSAEDRYCLECGAEMRSLSPEEQARGEAAEKQNALNAFTEAQEEFNHAQAVKDEKQKKMCYEAAALHVSVAYSKGSSFFDRADWKTISEIRWKCENELSNLRKRLKTGGVHVPLIKAGNTLYVEVLLNGTKLQKMTLDTGCALTLIPEAAATALSLHLGRVVMIRVADERLVPARQVTLSSIKLENAEAKDVDAHVLSGVNEGLLGMSFLENFKFQIDTENSELILEPK